jgi:hypothetical protein
MIQVTDEYFHESNLIEGFDSAEADACLVEAWRYLAKQSKLSHEVICNVQKFATYHQRDLKPEWRGHYRKIPVYIGGKEALDPADIDIQMNVWIASFSKSLSPKEAHIQFENIHPFVDGNGRTGRLLMWWMEMKLGEQPTLITYVDRKSYYDWFRS